MFRRSLSAPRRQIEGCGNLGLSRLIPKQTLDDIQPFTWHAQGSIQSGPRSAFYQCTSGSLINVKICCCNHLDHLGLVSFFSWVFAYTDGVPSTPSKSSTVSTFPWTFGSPSSKTTKCLQYFNLHMMIRVQTQPRSLRMMRLTPRWMIIMRQPIPYREAVFRLQWL